MKKVDGGGEGHIRLRKVECIRGEEISMQGIILQEMK